MSTNQVPKIETNKMSPECPETNLIRIKALSLEKEQENWDFRAFLKENCSSKKLDSIVHKLNQEITSAIDCTACGNCCTKILPVLDQEDIKRFARGLGISPKELREQYVVKKEEDTTFCQTPCPFLRDKKCTNYAERPKDCRSYPHLHKVDMRSRLMGVVENYGICPIVFNVYEALKQELWSRRRPGNFKKRL